MQFKNVGLFFFGLMLLSVSSMAQETLSNEEAVRPFKFLVGGALELGGDDVDEILFTNGETQSVKTGQGISVGVGTRLQIPSIKWLAFDATFYINN